MIPWNPVRVAVIGLRGIPATWGGVEHHCEQLYTRLAAKGYAVTIYGRWGYVPGHVSWWHGVRVRRIPTISTKYTDTLLYTVCAVAMAMAENPDIMHFHAQGPALFSWMPRLLRPRMKVFFTCHGLDWQRKKWPAWASWFIRIGERCSVIFPHHRIVVSRHLKDYYQTRYHATVACIPNGIALPPPTSAEQLEGFGLAPGSYFLWVGRIVPEKRLEDVLRAYLMKPRTHGLVIVGEGANGREYMEFLRRLAGESRKIRFVGYQYGDVLHQLYANAVAFVTASELEGLPITLLEALSHGIPCIASDIQPHREVLEPIGGMLYKTANIESLAHFMDEVVMLDSVRRSSYRRAALEIITNIYSWDRAAEQVDLLYRKALGLRAEYNGKADIL